MDVISLPSRQIAFAIRLKIVLCGASLPKVDYMFEVDVLHPCLPILKFKCHLAIGRAPLPQTIPLSDNLLTLFTFYGMY